MDSKDEIFATFDVDPEGFAHYDGILGCDRGWQTFQSQLKHIGAISYNALVFCFKNEHDKTTNLFGYVIIGLSKI